MREANNNCKDISSGLSPCSALALPKLGHGKYADLVFCEALVYIYSPDQLRGEVTKKCHFFSIPACLGAFGNLAYGSSILSRVF
jgi:hypothetical protein